MADRVHLINEEEKGTRVLKYHAEPDTVYSVSSWAHPKSLNPGEGRTVWLVVAHAVDPAPLLGRMALRWADAAVMQLTAGHFRGILDHRKSHSDVDQYQL
jgi:hypothetical protein